MTTDTDNGSMTLTPDQAAIEQPDAVDVGEIVVRPTAQG
jgi:hypothetical protein